MTKISKAAVIGAGTRGSEIATYLTNVSVKGRRSKRSTFCWLRRCRT